MKRVLSLILALVMLLAMFTMVGAAEGPEAAEATEAPAEPAPAAELAEEPAEPAEEPAETALEPAPAAEEPESAGDETAAPTEAPAEPTEAPVEPTAEPVVEPIAAPPADNGLEPASLPDLTEVTEQPAPTPDHRTVKLHANGGYFTGDHAGYDGFLKALVDGKLPKTDGESYPGDPEWYTPERPGYRFLGWYDDPVKANAEIIKTALNEGDLVPEGVTDLYADWVRVVVLDATPGNFWDGAQADNNYTRTVDLNGDDLPSDLLDDPVYDISKTDQTVVFDGWYTEKTTVSEVPDESGNFSVWKIETHGNKIEKGQAVDPGITTLYAGYKLKEEAVEKKTVTFYMDWNGIDGLWGKCLSVTRSYSAEDGGYKLTAGDLLIYGLNWDGSNSNPAKVETQQDLTDYWTSNPYNGYTFAGWATIEGATLPDVTVGKAVKNGQSLYAVWTKGENENSWTFKREEESAGPLTHLRFLDLKYEAHGMKNASITISPYAFPIGAEMGDVVWTFSYGTPNTIYQLAPPVTMTVELKEGEQFDGSNPGYAKDKNFGPDAGFKAEAKDGKLVITDLDGMDHAITVSVKAKAVVDGVPTGEYISSPAAAPTTAVFFHNWVKDEDGEHLDPTCATHGYDTYECTCGKTYEKIIPPLEHTWKFQVTKEATCTEEGMMQEKCTVCEMTFGEYQEWLKDRGKPVVNPQRQAEVIPATGHTFKVMSTVPSSVPGVPLLKEECEACHEEGTVKRGDVNGDDRLNSQDIIALYQFTLGKYDMQAADAVCDANGDGKINSQDIIRLFQYTIGKANLA